MKDFAYLFNNIQEFYTVAGLVLLNTVLGIWLALKRKNFSWSKSADFLKTILVYYILLAVGNMVDYYTMKDGYNLVVVGLEISGFKFVFTFLFAKELGAAFHKLTKIYPAIGDLLKKAKDEEDPDEDPRAIKPFDLPQPPPGPVN